MGTGDWYAALEEIVNRSHLATGRDIVWILASAASRLGMDTELYLVDLPQRELRPLRAGLTRSLPVDGTVAGRAFRFLEILPAVDDHTSRPILWVPVVDGTHRIGVLRLLLPAGTDPHDHELRRHCWNLAGVVAYFAISKISVSDVLHRVRRPKPLDVSAELLWQLLPPRTFVTPDMTVTAVVEYYDEAGGDGFDYTADDGVGDVAIFDAMGHDLEAGLVCSMALAATRNARRDGGSLVDMAERADAILRTHASEQMFTTAVLARLDLETGVLSYLNAGHHPPVLLRNGKVRKTLDGGRRLPLGLQHLGAPTPPPARERLQPGDLVLLYTDGVVEARNAEGEQFGLARLAQLAEQHAAAGLPAPETLRRLIHAVLEHQEGMLQDDATLILLEWPTPPDPPLLPF